MAWLKLEGSAANHRKTQKLARTLGVSLLEARGLLMGLWCTVVETSPDGDLVGWDADDLAVACGYGGDGLNLATALVDVHLLDLEDDRWLVHEWMDRAGSYKEAVRKQAKRAELKALSADSPGTVTGPSADCPQPVRTERRGQDREERTERTDPPKSAKYADDVDACWQVWRAEHPGSAKRLKSTSQRYKDTARRFKDDGRSVEEIQKAIRGIMKSPFHNGDNDSGWSATYAWVVGKDKNIETGIGKADDPLTGVPLTKTNRHNMRAEQWGREQFEAMTKANERALPAADDENRALFLKATGGQS